MQVSSRVTTVPRYLLEGVGDGVSIESAWHVGDKRGQTLKTRQDKTEQGMAGGLGMDHVLEAPSH
jgi:hypothetical protein